MSLLLPTLAGDPYDRPGHWMPWRRRCGAAEDLQPSWPRRIPWWVLDEAFTVPGASPRIPVLAVHGLLHRRGPVPD